MIYPKRRTARSRSRSIFPMATQSAESISPLRAVRIENRRIRHVRPCRIQPTRPGVSKLESRTQVLVAVKRIERHSGFLSFSTLFTIQQAGWGLGFAGHGASSRSTSFTIQQAEWGLESSTKVALPNKLPHSKFTPSAIRGRAAGASSETPTSERACWSRSDARRGYSIDRAPARGDSSFLSAGLARSARPARAA